MAWPYLGINIHDLTLNKRIDCIYYKNIADQKIKELAEKGIKFKVEKLKMPQDQIKWYQTRPSEYVEALPYPPELNQIGKARWDLHFPHKSNESKVILFFKTKDDFCSFTPTKLLYGRFLTEYFQDFFTADEIRDMATKYYVEDSVMPDIRWAITGDEIEWVFSNCHGFYSCAKDQQPEDPVHQARVYAAGDIHIAYLLNEEGTVKARAICWPEKKLIAGVYGAKVELSRTLERLGFRHITDASEMDGAKLAKLVYKNYYIGAHIDNFPKFTDKGDYLVADNKSDIGFYLYRCKPKYTIPPGGTRWDANKNLIIEAKAA